MIDAAAGTLTLRKLAMGAIWLDVPLFAATVTDGVLLPFFVGESLPKTCGQSASFVIFRRNQRSTESTAFVTNTIPFISLQELSELLLKILEDSKEMLRRGQISACRLVEAAAEQGQVGIAHSGKRIGGGLGHSLKNETNGVRWKTLVTQSTADRFETEDGGRNMLSIVFADVKRLDMHHHCISCLLIAFEQTRGDKAEQDNGATFTLGNIFQIRANFSLQFRLHRFLEKTNYPTICLQIHIRPVFEDEGLPCLTFFQGHRLPIGEDVDRRRGLENTTAIVEEEEIRHFE
mmetsp:Transcript_27606/g.47003  ORF Transcript_27606/g.47003 Transcript_27606/m.47003 type:complete len:290 (+) Transcript_27606:1152-2021(+)